MDPAQEEDADDALDICNGLVSSMTLFVKELVSHCILFLQSQILCFAIFLPKSGNVRERFMENTSVAKTWPLPYDHASIVSMGGTPAFSRKIGR